MSINVTQLFFVEKSFELLDKSIVLESAHLHSSHSAVLLLHMLQHDRHPIEHKLLCFDSGYVTLLMTFKTSRDMLLHMVLFHQPKSE